MSASLLERRQRLLGPNAPLFYDDPVHLVRGEGVWLWDAEGNRYLDGYNNVPHVGHGHPKVVEAIARQAATLNTHTRYLHKGILDYIERLTASMDPSLSTAVLTCTGSEANDVALRMAQAVSGKTGVIATDHTYHGNTAAVSQLSTKMPPIGGFGGHVRHVPAPDSYRAPRDSATGELLSEFADAFTDAVAEAIASLDESGHGCSALIICPYFANEGFPDLPPGFLDRAIALVRQAGGIVIADEVQPGFGRLGGCFWGHQGAGFVPDMLTLGKPMANGHPVGGVVTTPEIMEAFRSAFRYFNTFGGNPVSAAAALAMLDVLEEENLVENARKVGRYAKALLADVAQEFPVLGDVRGQGFFFGAEVVSDPESKTPDAATAEKIINGMRRHGVLMGKTGIHGNVLKIRPPLPFSQENADFLMDHLATVLRGFAVAHEG